MIRAILKFIVFLRCMNTEENNNKIVYENPTPSCACKVSLDYLGDKWILIIIRDLFRKRHTFTHFFNESSEGIATSVLADRLKKLCKIGVIDFKYLDNNNKNKHYYLTDRGIELYDIIFALQLWTIKNVDFTYSENTTAWKSKIENQKHSTIKSNFKEEYKLFRKEMFGF